jgi:branched-chain amino acid aminotransferase
MSGLQKTDVIWFNGRLVPWDEARVHVLAHGLQYGTGVFEGLRAYDTADGPAVFRLDAHLRRLFNSAALYEMQIPYTEAELTAATLSVVRENRLRDAYVRPIAFFDAHTLSLWTRDCPVSVAIAALPSKAYLEGGPAAGARVGVVSVRRFDDSMIPVAGKACGQYVNSVRAVQEALRRGLDEAILLNARGDISEGSGENLFIVKDGGLATNSADASILMGITRDAILRIAADLGLAVDVRGIALEELTTADELFFCGTAVEVTPIREVDGVQIGDGRPGPITKRIQQVFFEAVRGRRPEYRDWLAFVDVRAPAR